MKDSAAREALEVRISQTEDELEARITKRPTNIELARLDRSLLVLDRLLQRFPAKASPPWLMPLSVAVVAVSLLGVAAAIRVPRPLITLDVRLSALEVTAHPQGTGLSSDIPMSVRSLEVAGDGQAEAIARSVTSISSLRLMPGTEAFVEQHGSCFEVQIPIDQRTDNPGLERGLDLLVLSPSQTPGTLPTPSQLRARPGTTVTICGDFPVNYAFAGSIERARLYRRQPGDAIRGFVDLRTPSILSGKLRLPDVDRVSDIQDTDMLSLEAVSRGWMFLFPAPTMRVVFSGTVDRPQLVSPSPEGASTNLEPTLLEWLTKSKLSTALFGLITGFVGMLWSLAKYLGFSSR